jgi:hypothetical protein
VLCENDKTRIRTEDEGDDGPGHVVDGGCGRDKTSSVEDDGPVDVLDERVRVLARDEPSEEGSKGTNEEEEAQGVVDLSVSELALGTDDTPDDGGGTEGLCARADEELVVVADTRDVGEHPGLDTKLNSAGKGGRNHLSPEHGTRRDLHVVTELHVTRESERLSHGDVTPSLEQHHGDGLAGKHEADDELGDDVEADLLVGNSLDHSDGNDVEEG